MRRQKRSAGPGVTPLKDAVRVLNGFGRSLETILPKLRDGYLVETAELAQAMANEHTHAYFLTPGGECFHNATVTGGKPASAGPLVLKRAQSPIPNPQSPIPNPQSPYFLIFPLLIIFIYVSYININ